MSARAADELLSAPTPDESRTAALFGVDGPAIRWEHGMILFAALYFESVAKFGIARWMHGGDVRDWTLAPAVLLERLVTEAALALLAVLCCRLLRRPAIAIPVAAAGYGLVHTAYAAALDWNAPEARIDWFAAFAQAGVSGFVYAVLMLTGLEVAMRRWRNLPLAFLAASLAGAAGALLLSALVIFPLFFGGTVRVSSLASSLPGMLVGGALFALAWWGGLAIAQATPFFRPHGQAFLSRAFYAGSLYALFGVAGLTMMLVVLLTVSRNWRVGGVTTTLLILTWLVIIAGAVILMRFVYRMWDGLRGEGARTTPGKAVALLFVPLFNIYWSFRVFPGFASDFNRIAAARNVPVRLSVALFAAYPVVVWLAFIPIWGAFSTPLTIAILLAIVAQAADAVSALAAARPAAVP